MQDINRLMHNMDQRCRLQYCAGAVLSEAEGEAGEGKGLGAS